MADYTINFPLWFFHALFFADLCMYFIIKLSKYYKMIIFLFLLFITIPIQTAIPGRPVFHINVLPAALVYMLFGYGVNKLIDLEDEKLHISFGILLIFLGWYLSCRFGGNIAQIGNLIYYFESFCTILGFWIIFVNIRTIKILEHIGKHSVFILGLHALVLERATEFIDYMKQSIGFENEFVRHILIVALTASL